MTNMRRGLGAPLSGCFNNFFTDCMGSPIRSEIWAVICAGMPELAAYYAYQDASVDHAGGEGVYGEIFFAVLESLAFTERDKLTLIRSALSCLPEGCAVRQAVELLLSCWQRGMPWVAARQAIIDRFAGDNFTYAPVNIAFTLIGWLYEEGFTRQMLTTVNCGYDTDCTVATLGSLLGILYGTAYLDACWTEPLGERIITSRPITGFRAPATIAELTERSLAARKLVAAQRKMQPDASAWRIPYLSRAEAYRLPQRAFMQHDLEVRLYRSPVFARGESKTVRAEIRNLQDIPQTLRLLPHAEGFACTAADVTLAPGETQTAALTMTAPAQEVPLVRGRLEIARFLNGVYWDSESVPLSVWGTMDWQWTTDTAQGVLHLEENRITAAQLPPQPGKLILETTLTLRDAGAATLKFACANPLTVLLDGQVIIDCPERTAVIPAYHRADARKCAALPAGPGEYQLRVEVGDPESLTELYFMVVTDDLYCAYRLDSSFTVKKADRDA
ncbi:MAG: ADP-ribosylglycohydrolase family protein [Aristaeellaceae bacterium]